MIWLYLARFNIFITSVKINRHYTRTCHSELWWAACQVLSRQSSESFGLPLCITLQTCLQRICSKPSQKDWASTYLKTLKIGKYNINLEMFSILFSKMIVIFFTKVFTNFLRINPAIENLVINCLSLYDIIKYNVQK